MGPSSGSAFPPMSKAAPSPFGGLPKKEESKTTGNKSSSSSSAAFPPMSKAAPKPFGASSKKEANNPTEKLKTPSFATSSQGGSAFPPMSAAAPSPFGAFSKKEESKASETKSASTSSTVFPSMPDVATKPISPCGFGAGGFSFSGSAPSDAKEKQEKLKSATSG